MPDTPTPIRSHRATRGWDCTKKCAFGSPDCRPHEPGDHGIGSLSLFYSVALPGLRAVSIEILTGMFPRSVKDYSGPPIAVVDYHRSHPLEGETRAGQHCPLLDCLCWTESQYYLADKGYDALLAGGDTALYEWLEKLLREMDE